MEDQKEKLNEELLRSTNLTEIADLINRCVDIDAVDEYGRTILMIASEKGFFDVVYYLVDKGAKMDHQCNKKWTALISYEINALHSPHISEGYGLH